MNKLREEIARIIDAEGWAFADQERQDFPADPHERIYGTSRLKRSLAKADQIIAAWNRRADPLVEELRGALRRIAEFERRPPGGANGSYQRGYDNGFNNAGQYASVIAREALPAGGGSSREFAQATQVSSDPTANADEPRQADGAFVLTVTATADGHEIAIDHPMGSDAWIKARDAMAAAHAELARHLAKQEECPAKPAARHTETGHECGTCGHHWWGPLHEAPCPACQLEGGKA